MFSGNKDTLLTIPTQRSQDIRDELLKFHERYYSSNVMALTVLGKGLVMALLVQSPPGCTSVKIVIYSDRSLLLQRRQLLPPLCFFACLSVSVVVKILWINCEIWRRRG